MMNTVLVVDDNEINVELLDAMLSDDYIVYKALGGLEALDVLKTIRPDLVLLDIIMPDIDGFEVIQRIKADPMLEKIPVMFVTGAISFESESRGLELGAIDYITKPFNHYIVRSKVKNQMELAAYRTQLEQIVDERTKAVVAAEEAIIMSLALLAEKHDEGTGAHLVRVKDITKRIAVQLNKKHPELISQTHVGLIPLLSPVHDIGKIGVPDGILLKNGPLDRDEFEQMKRHTIHGTEVLQETALHMGKNLELIDISMEIVENHHEKFNGNGYPNNKKGLEIPLSARIVSVADVYDALVSERPYKKSFTHEQAMSIITEGDGRTSPDDFDPVVMEAFVDAMQGKRIVEA